MTNFSGFDAVIDLLADSEFTQVVQTLQELRAQRNSSSNTMKAWEEFAARLDPENKHNFRAYTYGSYRNLLYYILDPESSHGLGKLPLALFLISVAYIPAEIADQWIASDIEIKRNWNNISFTATNHLQQFILVIQDWDDNLEAPSKVISELFPDAKKIFLFQTEATDDMPLSYDFLPLNPYMRQKFAYLLTNQQNSSIPLKDVLNLYTSSLAHEITQRDILPNLYYHLYRNHQQALDWILFYRPHMQEKIKWEMITFIQELIAKENTLFKVNKGVQPLGDIHDSAINIHVREWLDFRLLRLFFRILSIDQFALYLEVTGGEAELRQRVVLILSSAGRPFIQHYKSEDQPDFMDSHIRVYGKRFITPSDDRDIDYRKNRIQSYWNEFLEEDFPRINEVIMRDIINNPELNIGVHNGTV